MFELCQRIMYLIVIRLLYLQNHHQKQRQRPHGAAASAEAALASILWKKEARINLCPSIALSSAQAPASSSVIKAGLAVHHGSFLREQQRLKNLILHESWAKLSRFPLWVVASVKRRHPSRCQTRPWLRCRATQSTWC